MLPKSREQGGSGTSRSGLLTVDSADWSRRPVSASTAGPSTTESAPHGQHVAAACRRSAEAEQRVLEHLLDLCPDARVAFGLAERFLQLVREREAKLLDAWLNDAAAAGLPEFRSFAIGLQRDKAAIVAAVSLPHSNGQIEGQVTKLKCVAVSALK